MPISLSTNRTAPRRFSPPWLRRIRRTPDSRPSWIPSSSVRRLVAISLALFAAGAANAQARPHLTIAPEKPAPGALVRVTLIGGKARPSGAMSGEPLHFRRAASSWVAYGAVPVDAQGRVTARAILDGDTLTAFVTIPRVQVATD